MWVARDKDGEVYLYDAYPEKKSEYFVYRAGYNTMKLDEKLFPEVTWENSPVRVELKQLDSYNED